METASNLQHKPVHCDCEPDGRADEDFFLSLVDFTGRPNLSVFKTWSVYLAETRLLPTNHTVSELHTHTSRGPLAGFGLFKPLFSWQMEQNLCLLWGLSCAPFYQASSRTESPSAVRLRQQTVSIDVNLRVQCGHFAAAGPHSDSYLWS